jgi:CheY-like chemotaxis protein
VTDFVRLKELESERAEATTRLLDRTAKMESEILIRSNELQEANETLRRQAAINDATLEASTDGIGMFDLAGERLIMNTAFERMVSDLIGEPAEPMLLGGRTEDLIARARERVVDPDQYDRGVAALQASVESDVLDEFELDGFGVLERLQADPETRRIPVVVLTARRLSAEERGALSSRAIALLEKSDYSADELRGVIMRALDA